MKLQIDGNGLSLRFAGLFSPVATLVWTQPRKRAKTQGTAFEGFLQMPKILRRTAYRARIPYTCIYGGVNTPIPRFWNT